MIKKLLLPIVVVAAFVGYIIYSRTGAPVTVANNPMGTVAAAPNTVTPATTTPVSALKYKDGTYTGSIADAYYGNLQVEAVISGGAISDVQFLQYPNARGNTLTINQHAMPILKSEAIAVQNANVDIISGATQTSQAFQQSLAAALDQAAS